MENETIEELTVKVMSKIIDSSVSWESFTSQLEANEEEFNLEIKEMEKLDIEAQNEALTFYVR